MRTHYALGLAPATCSAAGCIRRQVGDSPIGSPSPHKASPGVVIRTSRPDRRKDVRSIGRPTRLLRQVPQDSEPADSLDRRDVQQGVVVCRIGAGQHPAPEKSRIADRQHGAIGRDVVAVDAEVDDNPRKPRELEGSCDRVDRWPSFDIRFARALIAAGNPRIPIDAIQ